MNAKTDRQHTFTHISASLFYATNTLPNIPPLFQVVF